jgi:hypothetical protein
MISAALYSCRVQPRRTPRLRLSCVAAAFTVSLLGCSSSTPAMGGSGGAHAMGGATETGGATSAGGANGTGGAGGKVGAGGGAGTGGKVGTGGGTGTGGIQNAGGQTGSGGGGDEGGSMGMGGRAGVGGNLGTGGGSSAGGSSSTGGATNAGGALGTGGATGTGGSDNAGDCPTDALFCSGFEDTALPAKASYVSNIPTPVEVVVDSTVHHSGARSVKVNKGTSYVYRMLSVPAAKSFWFRAYMMTDVPIDQKANVHESFMGANWGQDKGVDIVQEQCQVAVNINDNPVLGSNGQNPPINCPADGQKIAANTWYCFEGSFDGGTGNLEIFVDGVSIIKGTAVTQAKQSFTNFRFGYVEYNGTNRTVWYDDVATAPTRIGCLK